MPPSSHNLYHLARRISSLLLLLSLVMNSLLSGGAQAKGTSSIKDIDASKSLQVELKAQQSELGESQSRTPLKDLRIAQQPQLVPITIGPTPTSGATPNAVPTTNPNLVTAYQGDTAFYGAQVLCGGNTSCLQSAFTITVINPPPGSTYSIVPNPVVGEQPFTVSIATGSVPPGSYSFSLNGNSIAGSTAFVPFTLIVLAPPSGTITPPSGSSGSATTNPGGNATYNLKLSIPSNYPGSLTMGVDTAGSSPQLGGTSYAFNPQTVNASASLTTLTARIATTTPPGTFNIKVTATPTPGSPGVNVPPFTETVVVSGPPVVTPPVITAIPSSITLEAGQTNVSTIISLQRNGLTGPVTIQVLSVNNATPGIGYQVVPSAVQDLYTLSLATGYQSTTPPNTPIQLVIGSNNPAQGIQNIVFPITVKAAPTVIRSCPTPPTVASLSSKVRGGLPFLVIRGSGLNTTGKITFNGIQATEYYISANNEITVKVPSGIPPGPVTFVITATGGTTTSKVLLTGDKPDLVAINTTSTGSGKTEIHALSSYPSSNYQKSVLDVAIPLLGVNPADIPQMIDFDLNGIPDLAVLNQAATGSGRIEFNVFSDASRYQTPIFGVAANYGLNPANILQLIDMDGDRRPDLVVLNQTSTGSGKTEIHVLSAASNYQSSILDVATSYALNPANILQMIDMDGDFKPDLAILNQTSTGSGKTEIHVLSAASNYQSSILNVATNFGLNPANILQLIDMDGDRKPDLAVINQTSTGSGKTEMNVLSAASNYQSFIFGITTAFPYSATNVLRLVNFGIEPNDLTTYKAPIINSFTPTSSFVGATVTITGAGFTGTTGVNFFGTPSTSYFVNSDTQMTATVPSVTKSSGPIGVKTTSGVASSNTNFTISAPVIVGFNFTTVPVGGTLIIRGSNLGGATSVKINGVAVPFTADSVITVLIPGGITSGLVSVTTPGGTATSTTALDVPAAPLDVSVVMEDLSILVLKSFAQYYSGYPTPVASPTNSPRNPAYRYNITPASRTTTVGCFTGASACPTRP
jgi:hypothetical protein